MRSRYSAFVLKDSGYLHSSWHPSTRPAEIDLEQDPLEWLGLQVEESRGGDSDLEGEVTFRAYFNHQQLKPGERGELHERSRFVREDGSWFYLDGEQLPAGERTRAQKVGRNSPCPCASGKKFKQCCGG
jgi:SEC-C motif-containing protein